MGFAAMHNAWWPQIKPLSGTDIPNSKRMSRKSDAQAAADRGLEQAALRLEEGGEEQREAEGCAEEKEGGEVDEEEEYEEEEDVSFTGREVCVFDNRGIGKSTCPTDKKAYTTTIMAMDALRLADHLGWTHFHLVGHSMGGMIATKVAATAPHRVKSLALISTSRGGFDILPRLDRRFFSVGTKLVTARTPESRARVDLVMHFSREFMQQMVGSSAQKDLLNVEYVQYLSAPGAMQAPHATSGHFNAVWTHKLTRENVESICNARIPTAVIHGVDDIVAHVSLGEKVAKRLAAVARFTPLPGAHMLVRERIEEVNACLEELFHAAEARVPVEQWVQRCSVVKPPGSTRERHEKAKGWKLVTQFSHGLCCAAATTFFNPSSPFLSLPHLLLEFSPHLPPPHFVPVPSPSFHHLPSPNPSTLPPSSSSFSVPSLSLKPVCRSPSPLLTFFVPPPSSLPFLFTQPVDDFVRSGKVVGVGSDFGSSLAVTHLISKIQSGSLRDIIAVPTTAAAAAAELAQAGVVMSTLEEHPKVDFAFTDADVVQEGTLFSIIHTLPSPFSHPSFASQLPLTTPSFPQLDFAFTDADVVQEGTLFSIIGRRIPNKRGSVLKEKMGVEAASGAKGSSASKKDDKKQDSGAFGGLDWREVACPAPPMLDLSKPRGQGCVARGGASRRHQEKSKFPTCNPLSAPVGVVARVMCGW
ncbi:unnamed protein product [Closterium sp. Yama58-4]|nr:unnamed protein product [Closterium sp. Yama58-4]